MKILKHLTILTLASIVISCNNNSIPTTHTNKIAKISWLIGEWHNNSPDGHLTETWVQQSDSIFAGKSFFIVGNDTVFSEAITIAQEGEELLYIPLIKTQNNGLPVKFKLTIASNKQLVFENPEHDFPQKITYTLINNDSLLAEISGVTKGQPQLEQFPMNRGK
jgi:hypothetical protein